MFKEMKMESNLREIININKYIELEKNKFIEKYKNTTELIVNIASVSDFTYLETLWTGSFGHFILAVHNPTNQTKTVKMINEQTMTDRRRNVEIEQKIMVAMGTFPFVVKLEYVVVDSNWVYMVMPLVSVGNLFDFLTERGSLNETTARFFTAQIILAMEFLHGSGLVHRNLKPENIIINVNGYLRLANFGTAKMIGRGRTYTFCGTPDYMAPEMTTFKGYGKAVDFWSLGVVLYEMVAGYPPFVGSDVGVLFANIANSKYQMAAVFSPPLRSLVKSTIQADLTRRLGNLINGISDIKNHSWFRAINWLQIINQQMELPYKINVKYKSDKDIQNQITSFQENDTEFFDF